MLSNFIRVRPIVKSVNKTINKFTSFNQYQSLTKLNNINHTHNKINSVCNNSIINRSFSSKKDDIDLEGEMNTYSGRQYEVALLGDFPDADNVGPFGTLERPAIIYSGENARIVGCSGAPNEHHRILWFNLKAGLPHVCLECGQVFKLVNDANYKENEHLVDEATKKHYEYYGSLKDVQGRVPIKHGPHSRQ